MKKNTLIILIFFLIILTGCNPKSSSSESNKTYLYDAAKLYNMLQRENKREKMPDLVSESEALNIARELVSRSDYINRMLWIGEGIKIDENEIYIDRLDKNLYPMKIDGYESLDKLKMDIDKIFVKEVYDKFLSYHFKEEIIELDGKLYYTYSEPIPREGGRLSWDMDNAKINYISKDRISIYADCTYLGDKEEGQIILVNDNGIWKLATNPYHEFGLSNTVNKFFDLGMENKVASINQLLELAGKKENGWRLEKGISEYIIEFDKDFLMLMVNDSEYSFSPINIYELNDDGKIDLVDKIFVETGGLGLVIFPKKDENGIITLDYANQISKWDVDFNENFSIFGYISEIGIAYFQKYDYVYKEIEWKGRSMAEGYTIADITTADVFGYRSYAIIPKYYGTKIRVEPIKTDEKNQVIISDKVTFVIDEIDEDFTGTIGKVTISYKDHIISVSTDELYAGVQNNMGDDIHNYDWLPDEEYFSE